MTGDNVLRKNLFLLWEKKNSSHVHKTGSWYLFRGSFPNFQFPTSSSVHFIWSPREGGGGGVGGGNRVCDFLTWIKTKRCLSASEKCSDSNMHLSFYMDWVVPLLLSPSRVSRKKIVRTKWPREILGREARERRDYRLSLRVCPFTAEWFFGVEFLILMSSQYRLLSIAAGDVLNKIAHWFKSRGKIIPWEVYLRPCVR